MKADGALAVTDDWEAVGDRLGVALEAALGVEGAAVLEEGKRRQLLRSYLGARAAAERAKTAEVEAAEQRKVCRRPPVCHLVGLFDDMKSSSKCETYIYKGPKMRKWVN
jgi:hypothetical protein